MKISPKQAEAIDAMQSGAPLVCWLGGTRNGKSKGMITGLVLHSLDYVAPNYVLVGYSVEAVWRNLGGYLMEAAHEFGLDVRKQGQNCMILGDAKFYAFGANSVRSQNPAQGFTANGAFLDEILLQPRSMFEQVKQRCSKPGAVIAMCGNKEDPWHWFKREYWDRADEIGMVCIESTLEDAPFIDAEFKAQRALDTTGHYRRRMLDNEWAFPEGLVYEEWTVRSDLAILPGVTSFIAYDAASSGTTAALLFQYDEAEGRWQVSDEYYVKGAYSPQAHLAALAQRWGSNLILMIDPSAYTAMKLPAMQYGFKPFKANNAMEAGLQQTASKLASGDLVLGGRCENLVAELGGYRWPDRGDSASAPAAPIKLNDHACDALRYGVMAIQRFWPWS